MSDLNLPWSYKHTTNFSNYGSIVDSKGTEICTVYGVFGTDGREHYIQHILDSVNPKEQTVQEAPMAAGISLLLVDLVFKAFGS